MSRNLFRQLQRLPTRKAREGRSLLLTLRGQRVRVVAYDHRNHTAKKAGGGKLDCIQFAAEGGKLA